MSSASKIVEKVANLAKTAIAQHQEISRLRGDLGLYGQHLADCESWRERDCTCGFIDALVEK